MKIDEIKQFLDSSLNIAYPAYVCAICDKNGTTYKLKGGYTSYEEDREPITYDTLFDLASLTKIVGPTMLSCRYIDKGLLNLEDTIDKFFETKYYAKANIKNLMTHTAGFTPEIRLSNYLKNPNDALNYILNQKPIYEIGSQVNYSCMGYIVLGKILEEIGNNSLDILCKQEVFNPLNMENITYRPNSNNKFAATEVPPNKNKALLGIVHDENARFLNGISANAGLFSPIEDLIKLVQMLLNNGQEFLSNEIFYLLTHNLVKNNLAEKRALGFKIVDKTKKEFFGDQVSNSTYGHTGFTGTSIVIDSQKNKGVILLTNRVHPTRDNKQLLNLRSEFHNLVFKK